MAYLRGPLTVTISHLGAADTVYTRSGPPSIWGEGLTHEDIEGIDDDPVWVGEATGPVAPPSGGGIPWGLILGGLGALAVVAAVVIPEKRSNPARKIRRKKARRGAKKKRRKSNRMSAARKRRRARWAHLHGDPDDQMSQEWRRVGMKRRPSSLGSGWVD